MVTNALSPMRVIETLGELTDPKGSTGSRLPDFRFR